MIGLGFVISNSELGLGFRSLLLSLFPSWIFLSRSLPTKWMSPQNLSLLTSLCSTLPPLQPKPHAHLPSTLALQRKIARIIEPLHQSLVLQIIISILTN